MRFNDWLANKLGNGLSSMPFFYLCVMLDLAELKPVISSHDVIVWYTYLSQTVIQLLALPILGAQNKLQSRNHDELKAKLSLQHKHIREIHKHLGVSDESRR